MRSASMNSQTEAAIALTRRPPASSLAWAACAPAAEQTAYVATLKERFGRRRNFVKLLA